MGELLDSFVEALFYKTAIYDFFNGLLQLEVIKEALKCERKNES